MQTVLGIFLGAVLVLLLAATVAEVFSARRRRREALYLVSRIGEKLGLPVCARPLSLAVADGGLAARVHYHLLAPGDERDSVTLKARWGGPTRLGNVLIDSDPARLYAAGLRRLRLGDDRFDSYFRVFVQDERSATVASLLAAEEELLVVLADLCRRTATGRFELDDLSGTLKIQLDDESLCFPSDVEEITEGILGVYRRYRILAGVT